MSTGMTDRLSGSAQRLRAALSDATLEQIFAVLQEPESQITSSNRLLEGIRLLAKKCRLPRNLTRSDPSRRKRPCQN